MTALRTLTVVVLALGMLSLAGCGDSQEEKALTTACNAKDDIGKQLTTLKNITPATFKLETVQQSITAIKDDLNTISEQLPQLKEEVQPQLKQANEDFKTSLTTITTGLLRSISTEEGKTQLKQAAANLATSYQQAFAALECPR